MRTNRTRNRRRLRLSALEKSIPNICDVVTEWSDPAHAADRQFHAALCKITEALVPPKPNELERTAQTAALRD